MNIESLQKEWAADSKIDTDNLAEESANIPMLHSKYYNLYFQEKIALRQINLQLEEMKLILTRFYNRQLTNDELKEYGLEYPDTKIVKSDVDKWVECHPDMVDLKKRSGIKLEKVDFLKSILSQISNRSFQINNSIKFLIFQSGG